MIWPHPVVNSIVNSPSRLARFYNVLVVVLLGITLSSKSAPMQTTDFAVVVDDTETMKSSAFQSVADQESIRVRQRNGVPRIQHVLLQFERTQTSHSVT